MWYEIVCPVDWYTFQISHPVCLAICDFNCVYSRTLQTLWAGVTHWLDKFAFKYEIIAGRKSNSRKYEHNLKPEGISNSQNISKQKNITPKIEIFAKVPPTYNLISI